MTSYDVLISRLDALEKNNQELHAQTRTDIAVLQHDVSHLQDVMYWGFAILAVVVAFVSLFVPMVVSRKESSPNVIVYGAMPAQASEKKEA